MSSDEENMTLQNEPEPEPEYVVRYTKDLSDKFFEDLRGIAERLQTDGLVLLSVMMSEAGVSAQAHNPNGDASGLIQFMPATLARLGWTKSHAEFRKLTADAQLPYVEKYFAPHAGSLQTVAQCYVATFLPALLPYAKDPNYVLCAKSGQLGWAYDANTVFDSNKDGKIQVKELEQAVCRNCVGPRWEQVKARFSGDGLQSAKPADLTTVVGLQTALVALGYKLTVDGIFGPATRAALVSYQTSSGITPDGIYGQDTLATLSRLVAE